MIDYKDINSFLHFGYLTNLPLNFQTEILPENNLSQLREKRPGEDEFALIEQGVDALKTMFKNIEGNVHIIPLSGGGLDSRTILAGLLELGLRDQIITVTFGSPNAWDYEIGNLLGKSLNLHHETLDLTMVELDQESLLATARNGSAWTFLFDAFYNSLICSKFGKDVTYWSGFMGGTLGGQQIPQLESCCWLNAKRLFAHRNLFPRSITLTQPNYIPTESLPDSPLIDPAELSYDDQLNFVLRQQNYVKRVITFKDYNYKLPFLASEWVDFILRIPRRYRENKYLYKKIILQAYPEIFSFPTEKTLGLPLSASQKQLNRRRMFMRINKRFAYKLRNNPKLENFFSVWPQFKIYRKINYIDFNHALRKTAKFKSLIYENIQELKKRNILDWLNLDQIWREHQNCQADHGHELMLLAALEISLKASN